MGYRSSREVFIPGPYLFILSVSLKCCVAFYVLLWQLLRNNGYMAFYAPISTHHCFFTLPTRNHCDMVDGDCETDMKTISELPYCEPASSTEAHHHKIDKTSQGSVKRKQCKYMDHLSATVQTGDDNVMLSTYIQAFWQTAASNCSEHSCTKTFVTSRKNDFYVADAEAYWFSIDHEVWEPSTELRANAYLNEGFLEFSNGSMNAIPMCNNISNPSCGMSNYGDTRGDHIRISDLLAAAGIDLDKANAMDLPRRESGLVLRVLVEYSNTVAFDLLNRILSGAPTKIRYTYKVNAQRTPLFEIDEIRADQDLQGGLSKKRLQLRKRGLYLDVRVMGKLGAPSLAALLLQVASRMALLAICDAVVGCFATQDWSVGALRADRNYKSILKDDVELNGSLLQEETCCGIPMVGEVSEQLGIRGSPE